MSDPSQLADPRHYFRLLLQRLLETQQCLTHERSLSPDSRLQVSVNASTLSEIKSWLEEAGDNWEIAPTHSFVRGVAVSGPVSRVMGVSVYGGPWAPFVPDAHTEPQHGTRRAPFSPLSDSTPQVWERSTNGRITFLPKSLPTKLPPISDDTSIG